MIKNIIFDVGNVLVEFNYLRFIQERGYSEEEQEILMKAVFRNPLWLDADRGIVPPGTLEDGFVQCAPEHEALIRDAYGHIEGTVWDCAYVEEWLTDLKARGYHLYVLSNYGQELYERTEDKMSFLPFMDGVVFSYRCHLLKPEPEIYQHLCDTFGILPGESVFLDDMLENVEAARRMGIHGIQFESYGQAREQLNTLLSLYQDEGRMSYCCE